MDAGLYCGRVDNESISARLSAEIVQGRINAAFFIERGSRVHRAEMMPPVWRSYRMEYLLFKGE